MMSGEPKRGTYRHGLAFIAVLAFVASFFGARLFAIIFPTVVVETQGIHFHHFWYGIAMISLAGWLGIVWRDNRFDRVFAIVYGLGAGFIGDEVGLLLTFGNYQSELSYQFFVGAVSFVIITMLLLQYGDDLEREVLHLSGRERLTLFGLFIAGFSAIFFAFGLTVFGLVLVIAGTVMALVGFERHRRAQLLSARDRKFP